MTKGEFELIVGRVRSNVEGIMGSGDIACCVLVVGAVVDDAVVEFAVDAGSCNAEARALLTSTMREVADRLDVEPPHQIVGGSINAGGGEA